VVLGDEILRMGPGHAGGLGDQRGHGRVLAGFEEVVPDFRFRAHLHIVAAPDGQARAFSRHVEHPAVIPPALVALGAKCQQTYCRFRNVIGHGQLLSIAFFKMIFRAAILTVTGVCPREMN
jgi:hypothetical protein